MTLELMEEPEEADSVKDLRFNIFIKIALRRIIFWDILIEKEKDVGV